MMMAVIVGMMEPEVAVVRRSMGRKRLDESGNTDLVDSCEVL